MLSIRSSRSRWRSSARRPRTRSPGHQERRGRRLGRRGRQAHRLGDHRQPVVTHILLRLEDQHQGHARTTSRTPSPAAFRGKAAAERQRAAHPARRHRRPADRDLPPSLRRAAGAALLVRRRRGRRSLQGLRGVSLVERIGGVEREILVSLDPDQVQAVNPAANRYPAEGSAAPMSIWPGAAPRSAACSS